MIRVEPQDVVEFIEKSYQSVGSDQTIIITRSNKRTTLFNQGVRARILWKEEAIENGDRIMVTKNNYFVTKEYEDLPFIANGDMFDIVRLRHEREMYGFRFVDATLRAVDYDWEINAILWLDTLTSDSPDQNYRMQQDLFERISEDYPEIRNRKEKVKLIYESPYYNALQIRFAYAVTCHKAQGGQWKHVYIDRGSMDRIPEQKADKTEQIRWLYTALTRATEKVFLV